MFLAVAILLGRTAGIAVAGEANRVPGGNGARSGQAMGPLSHVWLDCEQQNGKLEADEVGILDPPVPVMEIEGPDVTPS
jgi:hypothetical protein